MRTLTLTLALLLALSWQARAQDDGLYWSSDQPTQAAVTTLDGQKIFIGKPFTEKIDEVTLISLTNDNTDYSFELKQNKPYSADASRQGIVLVLQKKGLLFDGFGGDTTQRDYDNRLSDLDFVRKAAAFFKITPQDRKHPGYQFTARFVVNPGGYKLSDAVMVTLEITNCGTQSFLIQQPGIPGMLDVFSFTAFGFGPQWDPNNNAVANKPYTPGPIDMITSNIELKPQETRSIPVDLKDYLVIKKRGSYTIRGTYAFKVMSPDETTYRELWDDYATADFQVEIK